MQRNSVAICMVAQLCVLLAAMVFAAGQSFPGLAETILYGIYMSQGAFTGLFAQLTGWPLPKRLLLTAGYLTVLVTAEAVNIWLDSGGGFNAKIWLVHVGSKMLLPAMLTFILIELLSHTGVQWHKDQLTGGVRFRLWEFFVLLTVVAIVCCTIPNLARVVRPWLTMRRALPLPLIVAMLIALLTMLSGWLIYGRAKLLAACMLVTGIAVTHYVIIACVYMVNPMASDLPNVYLRMYYAALLYVVTFTVIVRLLSGWMHGHSALQQTRS